LSADEVIEIVCSLEPHALVQLRRHEAARGARPAVLAAIDHNLARKRATGAAP
jgi:hypothetical protein